MSRRKPSAPREDVMDRVARILALAQETADQAIADAHAEAEKIIADARQQAEQILGDARARSGTF
jgi:vacuolar-type H+-ATPase subunit H